jgi:hypothetical protein
MHTKCYRLQTHPFVCQCLRCIYHLAQSETHIKRQALTSHELEHSKYINMQIMLHNCDSYNFTFGTHLSLIGRNRVRLTQLNTSTSNPYFRWSVIHATHNAMTFRGMCTADCGAGCGCTLYFVGIFSF